MEKKIVRKIELNGKELKFEKALITIGRRGGRPVFTLHIAGQSREFYNENQTYFDVTTADGMKREVRATKDRENEEQLVYLLAGNPFDMQEPPS